MNESDERRHAPWIFLALFNPLPINNDAQNLQLTGIGRLCETHTEHQLESIF